MTGTNGQDAGHPVLMTAGQAAEYLGISERTIRRYIKSGKLETVLIGGSVRIQPEALYRLAAVSGIGQAPTGTIGQDAPAMSGTLPDPVAEALRDTVRQPWRPLRGCSRPRTEPERTPEANRRGKRRNGYGFCWRA